MTLISCPSCSKKVSEQANACPHCGHPIKSKISQDIEDVKQAAAWLALLILLPSLTVPTIISTLLDPGKLTEQGLTALWKTFILTAPLTVSIALIGILITMVPKGYKKTLSENPQQSKAQIFMGTIMGVIVCSIFILLASAWLSQSILNIPSVDVWQYTVQAWKSFWESTWENKTFPKRHYAYAVAVYCLLIIVLVMADYFKLYGLWNFVSSFAIGTFLTWVWVEKISPYFR